MKFEYANKDTEPAPVAYVDVAGDIRLRSRNGDAVVLFNDSSLSDWGVDWEPFEDGVKRLFYPGDKLTITF